MKKRKKRKEKPTEGIVFSAAFMACLYEDHCGFTSDNISLLKKAAKAAKGVDYDYEKSLTKIRADLGQTLVECAGRGLLPDVVRAFPKIRHIFHRARLSLEYTVAHVQASHSCGRELPTYKELASAIYGDDNPITEEQVRTARYIAERYRLSVTRRKRNRKKNRK